MFCFPSDTYDNDIAVLTLAEDVPENYTVANVTLDASAVRGCDFVLFDDGCCEEVVTRACGVSLAANDFHVWL